MTRRPSSSGAPALCSSEWLAAHLLDPSVRVLDGSFHLPGSGRDPREEHGRGHIPGARFFDIDAVCDESTSLPHMCPSPERFAAGVGALGITNRDTVIAYDAPGSAAAPRVWWMFRVFGHQDVAVLDGGLAKWMAEGRPVEDGIEDRAPDAKTCAYTARHRPTLVRSAADLLANLESQEEQVIDNRSRGRFLGVEGEPRPARKLGHIPGSVNIPVTDFLDAERGGVWRTPDELAVIFAAAGIALDQPTVATCGSGVTACSTALAAYLLGYDHIAVYDGSWTEWGNRDDTPVER